MSACCLTRSANEPASAMRGETLWRQTGRESASNLLWESAETQIDLLEVVISSHNINDTQFAHDDHASDVSEGYVWFVRELEPKFESSRETIGADKFHR